jgi:hypothetical protein
MSQANTSFVSAVKSGAITWICSISGIPAARSPSRAQQQQTRRLFAILLSGATPYSGDNTGNDVKALADYLAGYVASSSFTQGVLRRSIYQKAFDVFAQDQFQIFPTLTLNYGLRYTYNGPFSSTGVLSDFRPGASGADAYGLVIAGQTLSDINPRNGTNLAPRFGFSYQATEKIVVRGTYGIYFDIPNYNGFFFDNRPGNGGAVGVQANPTGATPVVNVSNSFYQWETGVDPFSTASGPAAQGLATISPNFRTPYIQNFNLNTEYQINRNTILQLGYVGSLGRRLFDLIDMSVASIRPEDRKTERGSSCLRTPNENKNEQLPGADKEFRSGSTGAIQEFFYAVSVPYRSSRFCLNACRQPAFCLLSGPLLYRGLYHGPSCRSGHSTLSDRQPSARYFQACHGRHNPPGRL